MQEAIGEDYFVTFYPDRYKDPGISAFTVAELGEMLPQTLNHASDGHVHLYYFSTYKVGYGEFVEDYDGETLFKIPYVQSADTEADARAKMLIYLLESHLIELPA